MLQRTLKCNYVIWQEAFVKEIQVLRFFINGTICLNKMAKMKKIPPQAHRIQILTLIPVYLNVFMMGCAYGWTAYAILFVQQGKEIEATPSQWSLFASSTEFGRIMLAIPSGMIVDKFGRKKITIGAGLLNVICWIALSITSSPSIIIQARFFLGIFAALVNVTALVTIGEIASPTIRGELSSMYYIFFNSGLIFQSVIGVIFSSYFMLSYFTLAVSCTFLISLFWVLETPQHLISVSKTQQARTNLEYIRPEYTESDIDFEFNGMQAYILKEKKEKQRLDLLQFLKTKSIRKPLVTIISISFFSSASGIALMGCYVTVIVPENDFVPTIYYPLILRCFPFILILLTPLFTEKLPRRLIFLFGAALFCLTNLFLAITDYSFITWDNSICKWLFIFGILLLSLVVKGSVQPMTNAMKSELFPQSVKGLGSSICVIFQSLANIILFQFYNIVTANWGQYCVFIILTVNSLILYLLIYFRLPEARGRYLADLQTGSDESANTIVETQSSYGSVEKEQIQNFGL